MKFCANKVVSGLAMQPDGLDLENPTPNSDRYSLTGTKLVVSGITW
jgi:hypothetical protein